MNKTEILCEKDRVLMQEFSRKSFDHMRNASVMTLLQSFFSRYMEGNVSKEIQKDRLIIEQAADAFAAGKPLCELDLEEIFHKTKTIDKEFLRKVSIASFTISISYSDIADIRIRRIWRISKIVYALLGKWSEGTFFTATVKKVFPENAFRDIILDILRLYILETRMLGENIRSPFHRALQNHLEALCRAMEQAAEELAVIYTQKIYGDIIHA